MSTVGGNTSITVGNGDDQIIETAVAIAGNDLINVGSGDDTISIGVNNVVAVPVSSTLGATTGFTANVSVGGTLLITGSAGLGSGGNVGSAIRAAEIAIPSTAGHGGHAFAGSAALPAVVSTTSATDTITVTDMTAAHAGIFTSRRNTDNVGIENSTFADLGVGLGTGKGSLSIGGTTTTISTTLVGLGTANTYDDLGGNSFANLYTQGLTPAPTYPPILPRLFPFPPPQTVPPLSNPPLKAPVGKQPSFSKHTWG